MVDTPKPPPLPPTLPLRLVRPRRVEEVARDLRLENERLTHELANERALVEVLRSQPVYRESRATEPTLPGVGPLHPPGDAPPPTKPSKRRRRRRTGALIVGALIGLAASVAGLRYPGLMGPINDFAKALSGAFQ